MPLVVDATGVNPAADALITRAYFLGWAANQGYDVTAYDPDTKVDPAIRRASVFANMQAWKGTKVNGRAQTQSWPRIGVVDDQGDEIEIDEIPAEVQQAVAVATYQELLNPDSLNPVVAGGAKVKSTQVGSLRKEYFAPPSNAEDYRPTMLLFNSLVDGLLNIDTAVNSLVGTSVRG
jgi:hypothetical protein